MVYEYRRVLVGAALALTAAAPMHGQGPSVAPTARHVLWLEFLKPSFQGTDTGILNGALFLGTRMAAGRRTSVAIELPVSIARFSAPPGFSADRGESTVGNPYVGVVLEDSAAALSGEIGLRIPLISDEKTTAAFNGIFTDFDRFEAFVPDLFPITARLWYRRIWSNGTMLAVRPGVALMVPREGDTDLFLDYAVAAGYEGPRLGAGTMLTGRFIATSPGTLSERSVHHLAFYGRGRVGHVEPGIELRVPLDDAIPVDYVLTLSLAVEW